MWQSRHRLISTQDLKEEEEEELGQPSPVSPQKIRDLFTFFQLLETFKSDLELVLIGELGWVVEDIDPKKRDDRHVYGRYRG